MDLEDPAAVARLALACLDLTSLNTQDSETDMQRLAGRARGHFGPPAALCVWPRLIGAARRHAPPGLAIAAVANFPDGEADARQAQRETVEIVQAGAQEIDLVLPWRTLQAGGDITCARLVGTVRRACGALRLKVILETGELRDPALIRRAAQVALAEGADFLKTSTGKTAVGATPEAARVMLEVIAATPRCTAGFKAAGGVRTVDDVAVYAKLVREHLGDAALAPQRFRLGASGLLDDIEAVLGDAPPPPAAAGY